MVVSAHRSVVFVIGPADNVYGRVFDAIHEALEGFNVIDWRKVAESGSATSALVRHLYDADVVIADLRGNKPNVFYEIGVAHALSTPVICISEAPGDVPFDLADLQKIAIAISEGGVAGRDDFKAAIQKATDHALGTQQSTPVSAAGLARNRPPRELAGMPDARALWETLARENLIPRLISPDRAVRAWDVFRVWRDRDFVGLLVQ
jgi:hypothetical protein